MHGRAKDRTAGTDVLRGRRHAVRGLSLVFKLVGMAAVETHTATGTGLRLELAQDTPEPRQEANTIRQTKAWPRHISTTPPLHQGCNNE